MSEDSAHSGEHGDHDSGHGHKHYEMMFRKKFFVSTTLSVPILIYSSFMQSLFNFSMPAFTGSNLVVPVFSV